MNKPAPDPSVGTPPSADDSLNGEIQRAAQSLNHSRSQNPMDENVKKLLEKAAEQKEGHHAMNFAQAALNAAHAVQVMKQTEKGD